MTRAQDEAAETNRRAVRRLSGRYALACVLAVLMSAYLFVMVAFGIPPERRLDYPALGFVVLVLAAIGLMFSPTILQRISTLQVANIRLELAQIRERQIDQNFVLQVTRFMLPLVIPETERSHLMNLYRGITGGYVGSDNLRAELRRMRYAKLIDNDKGCPIAGITDRLVFDLVDFVSLTDFGRYWANEIENMEKAVVTREAVPR